MILKCSILFNMALALVSGQIYFPNEQLDEMLRGNATALGPRLDLSTTANKNNVDVDLLVARSISKLMLDINRVAPSPAQQWTSNLVFAPMSIAGVMALVLLASIGQTFDEIVNFMGFNTGFNIQNDILEVHRQLGRISARVTQRTGFNDVVAYKTAIFVQEDYPVRVEYRQAATYFYQSDIINLNFKTNADLAKNYINSWVSDNTNGKITSLLDDGPDSRTKAIIASVLYFKGAWEQPFFKGASNWKPFYVNGRKSRSDRNVTMMYNGGEFPYYKDKQLNVEVLGFPYKGKSSTMYVILPSDSSAEKLRQLENYLTPTDLERFVSSTKPTEAVIAFPKMRIVNTLDLGMTMQNLGVRSLFNAHAANLALLTPGIRQRFADVPHRTTTTTTQRPMKTDLGNQLIFSRFGQQSNCQKVYDFYTNNMRCRDEPHARNIRANTNFLENLRNEHRQFKLNPEQVNPGLYADQFIHKVFIDITEDGTEAGAVSGLGINRSGSKVTFRCDVPFLFFIYQEDTKMILFWGSIKSPTPSVINRSK